MSTINTAPHVAACEACAANMEAAGLGMHAGMLRAMASHLKIYQGGDYVTAAAATAGISAEAYTAIQAMRIKDPGFDRLLKKTGIEAPLHYFAVDQKLEAAGISGRDAVAAKLKLQAAGLLLR